MDDLIISKANEILSKSKAQENIYNDILSLTKILQGSTKPNKNSTQFVYLKLFDLLAYLLPESPENCIMCVNAHKELLLNCSDPTMFLSRLLTPFITIVTEDFLDSEAVHSAISDLVCHLSATLIPSQLRPVLVQLVPLLLELLENSFKAVKANVCKSLSILSKVIPLNLQEYSKEIIECLIHSLKHPDSNVRLTSLEAIRCLAFIHDDQTFENMFGLIVHPKSDWFKLLEFSHDNILSTVMRDEDSQIRKSFFTMISDWLLKTTYRAQIEPSLIPFLIFGLFDPVKEVCEHCWDICGSLGIDWEKSHNCLTTLETVDISNPIYPWHPFENRARFGCRMYMLKFFVNYSQVLLSELANITSCYRETAAKVLFALLILTEHVNEENLEFILNGLISAISLSDTSKSQVFIYQSLELVGRFVPSKTYMKIINNTRSALFCMFFCKPVKTVQVTSQLAALNHLILGSLHKPDEDLHANLAQILNYIKKYERCKYSLQLCQVLIDSSFPFPPSLKSEVFSLLVEHDHESVSKYLKKLRENWYQLDLSHLNETIQKTLAKVSALSSSDWRRPNHFWPVFSNLCKHCKDYIETSKLLPVFSKIFNASDSPYHVPAMRVMRSLNFYSIEVINSIITKCLLGKVKTEDKSVLRLEALHLLRMSEHHNVEMGLFEALSACLDDPQLGVKLDACDEIHRQFTFVKIYGVEKFTRAKDQSNIVTKLMLKLISMLEQEDNSMLNCLHPIIDVIGLFPEEIDLNEKVWSRVLKRLVGIVMDEENMNKACGELAHLCVIAVTNCATKDIIDALKEIAKKGGKTAEYVESMLSSD